MVGGRLIVSVFQLVVDILVHCVTVGGRYLVHRVAVGIVYLVYCAKVV